MRADDVTAKYFEQLRQRRLFSLAEGYCLRKLTDSNLSSIEEAEFTIELSRTFAEHAKYTIGDEQADLWQRAGKVIDEFLEREPQNPKRLLLDVQSALIPAAQAEYLRGHYELLPFAQDLKKHALTALSRAIPKLIGLEKGLDERVRKAQPGQVPAQGELGTYELRTLLYNVRFRLGASYLDQAKLLAHGSADHADALLSAE